MVHIHVHHPLGVTRAVVLSCTTVDGCKATRKMNADCGREGALGCKMNAAKVNAAYGREKVPWGEG